jgi:hypothetical protein
LRFTITPGESVVWGFNIRRDIVYNAEMIRWVRRRVAQGFVSRFGHLTFVKPPAPPPPRTAAVHARRQEHVTASGSGQDLSAGLDFRMGLGTARPLSASVNRTSGRSSRIRRCST